MRSTSTDVEYIAFVAVDVGVDDWRKKDTKEGEKKNVRCGTAIVCIWHHHQAAANGWTPPVLHASLARQPRTTDDGGKEGVMTASS
jgi:hypothetical protein